MARIRSETWGGESISPDGQSLKVLALRLKTSTSCALRLHPKAIMFLMNMLKMEIYYQ